MMDAKKNDSAEYLVGIEKWATIVKMYIFFLIILLFLAFLSILKNDIIWGLLIIFAVNGSLLTFLFFQVIGRLNVHR